MSDAVIVGLMAGISAVLASAITAVFGIRHHRQHEVVASETREAVARIEISANGKLEKALDRISELESMLARHMKEPTQSGE